jgi:hypothetical protein
MSCSAGAATLDLLRAFYATLAPLLDAVACAPLPSGPEPRASSLQQRAWLLQARFASVLVRSMWQSPRQLV